MVPSAASVTDPAPAPKTPAARYAVLSIAAALATMGLKAFAWWLTGSVGLLADALESLVNLGAAVMAFAMLVVAARPPDEEHAYGYSKAEYFASGIEGTLIVGAAGAIVVAALRRLAAPHALTALGTGLLVTVVASLLNLGVALLLLRGARVHRSIALEADAHHLLTDVWTSAGVVVGVGAVALTGRVWLDPVVALVVAGNIIWVGVRLARRSFEGLLDRALPPADEQAIRSVLARYRAEGVEYHALRTRQAGGRSFVSLHVLVPGTWTVQRGHALLERIEADIRRAVPNAAVLTHLEPVGDPVSYLDVDLDRGARG
jgi:cation diffusion facilitator family transporter